MKTSLTAAILLINLIITDLFATEEYTISGIYDSQSETGVVFKFVLSGIANNSYVLRESDLMKAVRYCPKDGELSVEELINSHLVRGNIKIFLEELKALNVKRNPQALALLGSHMITYEGPMRSSNVQQAFLKMSSSMGIPLALNTNKFIVWLQDRASDLDAESFVVGMMIDHHQSTIIAALEDLQKQRKARQVLIRAAEGGAPGGASQVAKLLERTNPSAALQWYFINYLRGPHAMDHFEGLKSFLDFLSWASFNPEQVKSARQQAIVWLVDHGPLEDGYDRLKKSVSTATSKTTDCLLKPVNLVDLFWQYFAKGHREDFAQALEDLDQTDSNVLYIKAHLARGYINQPDSQKRLDLLYQATNKQHPFAYMDVALERLLNGLLAFDHKSRQTELSSSFNILRAAYNLWHLNDPYLCSDITSLLGYFYQNGWGIYKDLDRAKELYEEGMTHSCLGMSFMAQFLDEEPILQAAMLYVSRGRLTGGDWFNGARLWLEYAQKLDETQMSKVRAVVLELQKLFPSLQDTMYQRLAKGLDVPTMK